jgi:hypothetical protein
MKIPWRRLKFVALGLGLVIGLGLIYWAVANARAAARVAEKIAALRAAGEPTALVDLRRAPIAPETNAMTYLDKAAPAAKAIVSAVDDVEETATEDEQDAFEENRPSPAILAAMREALAAHPEVVPLFERAAACPDFDPELDYSAKTHDFLIKAMQGRFAALRNVWRVLRFRALVQLADGQRDDALRTCLFMFRLARHADQQPLLINFLVTTALRMISIQVTTTVLLSGPVAPELRAELEAELAKQDLTKNYREALRGDRAYGTEYFHEMAEGPMGLTYRQLPMFKNDQCDYLDLFEFIIQSSDRPYNDVQVTEELARVEREAGVLTGLMLPAVNATRVARFRTETLLHALRVLNAIQGREQAGDANEPKLSDLGLPGDATIDPVNDKPLHIKKTPQGWLIYGVGANLKDDGGQLKDYLDFGIGAK